MEPEAGVAYPLHLGASLLGKHGAPEAAGGAADEFCTLRYDFKPASAARAAVGHMDVQPASQKVSLQMGEAAFSGKYEPSRDGLDCVAIFDGTSFRLELLGASVKSLRHVQGGARSAPPAPAGGGSVFQAAAAAPMAADVPGAAAAPAAAGQEPPALDAGASMQLEDELMRALADEGEEDGGEAAAEAAAGGAAAAAAEGAAAVEAGSEEEVSEEEGEEEEEAAAAEQGAAPAAAAAPQLPLPLLPAAPSMPQEEMNDLDRMFFGFDGGPDAAADEEI